MSKAEYQECMARNMGGGRLKGLSKEERQIEFCAIAKQCSGKAKDRDEALRVCSLPKAPKPPKTEKTRRHPAAEGHLRHLYYDPEDGTPKIPDGYQVIENGQ